MYCSIEGILCGLKLSFLKNSFSWQALLTKFEINVIREEEKIWRSLLALIFPTLNHSDIKFS